MNYEDYDEYTQNPTVTPVAVSGRRGPLFLMAGLVILFVFVVFGSIRTVRGWQDANQSTAAPADILTQLKADHLTRCEVGEHVVVFQLAPGAYSVRCAVGR